jgi:hypothetical protein
MKLKKDNKPKISFSCIYKCRRCNETFTNGMVTIPVDSNSINFLHELYMDDELEAVSHKTIIHRCEGLRKPIYGVAEIIEFTPYKL